MLDTVEYNHMRTAINHHQKAQIALAALKGDKTLAELSSQYNVHASKIEQWKQLLQQQAARLFAEASQGSKDQQRIEQLQKIIGARQEEIDWLKKKLHIPESSREKSVH